MLKEYKSPRQNGDNMSPMKSTKPATEGEKSQEKSPIKSKSPLIELKQIVVESPTKIQKISGSAGKQQLKS